MRKILKHLEYLIALAKLHMIVDRRFACDINLERVGWWDRKAMVVKYVTVYRRAVWREATGGRRDIDGMLSEADAEATKAAFKLAGY